MPNRLADATSPYLHQHADNPVDWYEWGEEAFDLAKTQDRPVLLSVGYAACHWCHVMAHESFEDEATAAFMNAHFINVKVDREERPDVDRIYMDAVQAMTGHGGWPMTVFLTPDAKPFYAGTYFPKEPRGHHPTFMRVLTGINAAWHEQRDEIEKQAGTLTEAVRQSLPPAPQALGDQVIPDAIALLEDRFDRDKGGFGGAPKFPQAPTLELLLRVAADWHDAELRARALRMLTKTLDEMAAGGIYDHLYGGFARYSVDAIWLVPHFEKMLYDNALLARVYTHAWSLTDNAEYRRVAEETLDYLVRDMRHPSGGILSAEDADSEGEEGKFAVWNWDEFVEVTGEDAAVMAAVYGVSEAGNFEGATVLERYTPLQDVATSFGITMEELRSLRRRNDERLVTKRRRRIPPAVDDKVVAAWNGLAMRAFAEAGAALGRPDYTAVAEGIAGFIESEMTRDGRLLRAWRDGRVSGKAFCDDYAAVATGLFALYQATGEVTWFQRAIYLTDQLIDLFATEDQSGFFATGHDSEELIARPINLMDNPTPSDNSLAAEALAIRAALTGEAHLERHIAGVIEAAGMLLGRHPTAIGHLLALIATSPLRQVAIIGPDPAEMLETLRERFRPGHVVAMSAAGEAPVPLLTDRTAIDGAATAYVCEGFVCKLPTTSADELRMQLEAHLGSTR
ncbi:MAG: thioredoxin domain-containing protein [Acidimicrobiia bacterium]|nr:thioredoxin domain-containing protein [Acidimicrobiia bacterium]